MLSFALKMLRNGSILMLLLLLSVLSGTGAGAAAVADAAFPEEGLRKGTMCSGVIDSSLSKQTISILSVEGLNPLSLVVNVHPSLEDTYSNASMCLPSAEEAEQCTFRSAVALCVSYLTSPDRNCTIKMPTAEEVLLSPSFGALETFQNAEGTLIIDGNGASFSLDEEDSGYGMSFLYLSNTVSGYLSFVLTECRISLFGSEDAVTSGAIYLAGVQNVRLDKCEFFNNTGNVGGAVSILDDNTYVDVTNCTFYQNRALSLGGGLYIGSFNSYFKIENSTFLHNAGHHGAGLYVGNFNADFLIEKCEFINNIASGIGAGLYINNDNTDNFNIANSNFIGNTALNYYGAGLNFFTGNTLTIQGCNFIANVAKYGAGFNGDSDNDYTVVIGCYFEGNVAGLGGGMEWYASNLGILIANCTFHKNVAYVSGGALTMGINNEMFIFRDVVFTNNTSDDDGGAISFSVASFDLTLIRCVFQYNTALNSGGAIYSATASSHFLAVSCTWEFNSCGLFGGALYMGDSHFGVALRNSSMTFNSADSGGALYVNRFNDDVEIDHCDISNNHAVTTAGGIFSASVGFELLSSRVIQNEVSSGDCAGAYVSYCTLGYISGSNFTLNRAHVPLASSFLSMVQGVGGGLCLHLSSNIRMEESVFISNFATNGGGAISFLHTDSSSIETTNFFNNSAANGGSVLIRSGNVLNISNALIKDSVSTWNGGGMMIYESNHVKIQFSRFVASSLLSNGFGSSVWAHSANMLTITGNSFEHSTAPAGAGTVFWTHQSMTEPVGLWNNSFTNCQAIYGAEIATEGVNLKLDELVVTIAATAGYIDPLSVILVDFYQQRVFTESTTTVYMYPVYIEGQCPRAGFLTGGISEIFDQGSVLFDSLEVRCQPSALFNVTLVATSSQFSIQQDFNFFFEDCQTGEIHDENLCVECPQGFYSFNPLDTECTACPDEASCPGGSVMHLNAKYWRQSQTSHDVVACPNPDNCLGGENVSHQCRVGHEGPLCNVCEKGYAISADKSCIECASRNGMISTIAFSVVFVIIVIACCVFFNKRQYLEDKYKIDKHVAKVKSFKNKGKILISFLQIISTIPVTLNITYPTTYRKFLSALTFINIDIISLFTLGCVVKSDFYDKLRFYTLGPMVLAFMCIALLYVRAASATRQSDASNPPTYSKKDRNNDRRTVLIVLGFLFFSPTSIVIFETFVCDTFEDGTQTLVADSSVSCYTEQHVSHMIFASFMIVVYPIGVPLYYSYHLYRHRNLINPDNSLVVEESAISIVSDAIIQQEKMILRDTYSKISNLKFLFASYLPKHMYFEVIECFRRLLLTAIPILLLRSTGVQIVMVLLVSLLFTAVYMELKPYASASDNKISILCQWAISLTLIGSLCLRVDMVGPEAVGIILTVLNSIVLVITALCVFFYSDNSEEQVGEKGEEDGRSSSVSLSQRLSSLSVSYAVGVEKGAQEDSSSVLGLKAMLSRRKSSKTGVSDDYSVATRNPMIFPTTTMKVSDEEDNRKL